MSNPILASQAESLRGGTLMSEGNFQEMSSQRIVAATISVGRLGVSNPVLPLHGYATLRHSTLRHSTLRYATVRYATLRYSTL